MFHYTNTLEKISCVQIAFATITNVAVKFWDTVNATGIALKISLQQATIAGQL